MKNFYSSKKYARSKYLGIVQKITQRNVVIYYSGWLQHPELTDILYITDNDKDAFVKTIKGLDATKGIDLVLHTPGGDIAATESLHS
jgi:ClpP class serine protease